jgi:peptide-methionine (R)-S-oxide reductase
MKRRTMLWSALGAGSSVLTGGLSMALWSKRAVASSDESFEFQLSEEEWRKRLSPEAYAVLRADHIAGPKSPDGTNQHQRAQP